MQIIFWTKHLSCNKHKVDRQKIKLYDLNNALHVMSDLISLIIASKLILFQITRFLLEKESTFLLFNFTFLMQKIQT